MVNNSTIAIMQPYVFPYIGYYQLANAVDTFVFYDDVNFVTRSWINRNRILINGKEKLITFPCLRASQNKLINETQIDLTQKEYDKIKQSIELAYKKAPHFNSVNTLIGEVFNSTADNISTLAIHSVKIVFEYLGINKNWLVSSENFSDSKGLEKQERLINMVTKNNSHVYINAIGGMELYSKDEFKKGNIELYFLKPMMKNYKQLSRDFIPGLSIIDVLMFNSIENVKEMLNQYELL